ncbi:hypothetical protein B0T16DRAFT_449188 [Cercophora newfieldiana]|uniref:Fucose-specific lectin n=1 Tax=Cercophora newfieldiana TaxID=92897 RepID=A0AA39XX12_9PEZI|nr:hypothetical protein B0T16DRAFT_449188 [Cercophora newfieldiana]
MGPSDLPEAVPVDYGHVAPEALTTSYPEVVQLRYEPGKYFVSTGAPDYHHPTWSQPPPPSSAKLAADSQDGLAAKRKPIWGIPRRKFIIICVIVVLLVIGIVVAVAVAVTRKSTASQSITANSPPTNPIDDKNNPEPEGTGLLLASTSLASANFTEETSGATHYYLFSQSTTGDLLASHWASPSRRWTTISISKYFSSNPNLTPMLGTPLAAFAYTNPAFQMRVYFLTPDNSVHELVNTDPYLGEKGWSEGALGRDAGTIITVGSGSRIAALRPQCGTGKDCRERFPQMALAYQTASSVVMIAKSPKWQPQVISPAENRTVMGLSAIIETQDIVDFQWRFNFFQGGLLQEHGSNGGLERWVTGRTLDKLSPAKEKSMVSFPFDLWNTMVLTVEGDGTLWARVWDGRAGRWDQNPVDVSAAGIQGGASFKMATGNSGQRIYALLGGVVHEWGFRKAGSLEWSYIGNVTIEL